MIESAQPLVTFDVEMERLGCGEVIHTFTNEEDGKTFTVARSYWDWLGLNTYTLFAQAEKTRAHSTWRDLIPSLWSPRTSLEVENAQGTRIGAIATGLFRVFPTEIMDSTGQRLATLNYSGETWLIHSIKTGSPIASLEPKATNAKGITPWKLSVYTKNAVDPRLLGITAAFVSHYYSQPNWPTYLAREASDGLSLLWSAACTLASFGFNGICALSNWAFDKIEKLLVKAGFATSFLANDVITPVAYSAAVIAAAASVLKFAGFFPITAA